LYQNQNNSHRSLLDCLESYFGHIKLPPFCFFGGSQELLSFFS
jgi:hypothetical protein